MLICFVALSVLILIFHTYAQLRIRELERQLKEAKEWFDARLRGESEFRQLLDTSTIARCGRIWQAIYDQQRKTVVLTTEARITKRQLRKIHRKIRTRYEPKNETKKES